MTWKKALWALKFLNLDLSDSHKKRWLQLNELDEFRMDSYDHSAMYKERTKHWHDRHIRNKNFEEGMLVLKFNQRLRLFPGKLKSKWTGPFKVKEVHKYGSVTIEDMQTGELFKVNGHLLKPYHGNPDSHDKRTST